MNDRDEGISPVRGKSKLKKRRRQRESELSSFSLQRSIPSVAAAASSSLSDINKKRCSADPTTKNENTVVGLGEVQHNSSLQKENNDVSAVKSSCLSGRKGLTDPLSQSNNLIKEKATSKLSFIDEMDLTQLSTIGNDIMSSSSFRNMDVTSELLEKAFASNDNIIKDSATTDNNNNNNNVFYHDVIGRIGPPDIDIGDDSGAFSIAFPRCNTLDTITNNNHTTASPIISMPLQNLNLKRETCYGMSIPLSWCQFPGPQLEQGNTSTKATSPIIATDDVTDQIIDSVTTTTTNELVAKEEVVSSSPTSLQYQGRIRITSDKGATIREVFDIDESDYVVGKLNQGDERYFIEKMMLPAPPLYDDDESDDDVEDCVAVVRYKIVLNEQHDCFGCSHEYVERDTTSGKMVAWVSDRGRLANDQYFILKELDVNA